MEKPRRQQIVGSAWRKRNGVLAHLITGFIARKTAPSAPFSWRHFRSGTFALRFTACVAINEVPRSWQGREYLSTSFIFLMSCLIPARHRSSRKAKYIPLRKWQPGDSRYSETRSLTDVYAVTPGLGRGQRGMGRTNSQAERDSRAHAWATPPPDRTRKRTSFSVSFVFQLSRFWVSPAAPSAVARHGIDGKSGNSLPLQPFVVIVTT